MTESIILIPIIITIGTLLTTTIDKVFSADLTERQIEEMIK